MMVLAVFAAVDRDTFMVLLLVIPRTGTTPSLATRLYKPSLYTNDTEVIFSTLFTMAILAPALIDTLLSMVLMLFILDKFVFWYAV